MMYTLTKVAIRYWQSKRSIIPPCPGITSPKSCNIPTSISTIVHKSSFSANHTITRSSVVLTTKQQRVGMKGLGEGEWRSLWIHLTTPNANVLEHTNPYYSCISRANSFYILQQNLCCLSSLHEVITIHPWKLLSDDFHMKNHCFLFPLAVIWKCWQPQTLSKNANFTEECQQLMHNPYLDLESPFEATGKETTKGPNDTTE